MKALEILKDIQDSKWCGVKPTLVNWKLEDFNEAIKELEELQKEKDLLEEYVQFARLHIETYRCNCGSLGRVGYLCSNKECGEQ